MKVAITSNFDEFLFKSWARLVQSNVSFACPCIGADFDVVVVVNAPHNSHILFVKFWIEKRRPLIVCQMEPNMHLWGEWANPWMLNPVTVFEHTLFSGNVMEWWRPEGIDELLKLTMPQKRKELSMILSSKNVDPGHVVRIETCRQLQKSCDLHLFGTIEGGIVLPPFDKRRGTDAYAYHATAENHKLENYVTEKMFDGILAGCLVFWWGGEQNIVKSDCFVRLFDSPKTNANLIRLCIAAKVHDKKKGRIWDERNRLLREWNIGHRLSIACAGLM